MNAAERVRARSLATWHYATRDLSGAEVGAFIRLMHWHLEHACPLPAGWDDLYTIARCRNNAERKTVRAVINRFCTPSPEGWQPKD